MTNQETLPVWAKILLGLPANDAVPVKHSGPGSTSNSSQTNSTPSDAEAAEQSVLVFDPASPGSKWGWRGVLRPARREFQP